MSQIDITQVAVEYMAPFVDVVTIPGTTTKRFDAGDGSSGVDWYVAAPLSDSGDPLRDKNLKDAHVVGKVTDANVQYYAYGPGDPINVSDIEEGINSSSGVRALPDTTMVERSPKVPINVPNAMEWTVRVGGRWGGGAKDRVDSIVVQVAQQGVRR